MRSESHDDTHLVLDKQDGQPVHVAQVPDQLHHTVLSTGFKPAAVRPAAQQRLVAIAGRSPAGAVAIGQCRASRSPAPAQSPAHQQFVAVRDGAPVRRLPVWTASARRDSGTQESTPTMMFSRAVQSGNRRMLW